jgi:hypothetical protein
LLLWIMYHLTIPYFHNFEFVLCTWCLFTLAVIWMHSGTVDQKHVYIYIPKRPNPITNKCHCRHCARWSIYILESKHRCLTCRTIYSKALPDKSLFIKKINLLLHIEVVTLFSVFFLIVKCPCVATGDKIRTRQYN